MFEINKPGGGGALGVGLIEELRYSKTLRLPVSPYKFKSFCVVNEKGKITQSILLLF